jgi:hypothetical protein
MGVGDHRQICVSTSQTLASANFSHYLRDADAPRSGIRQNRSVRRSLTEARCGISAWRRRAGSGTGSEHAMRLFALPAGGM